MAEKRAVIFCAANKDINPEYNQIARSLARMLCEAGYTIVSGGTIKGTMAVISEEVVSCGGKAVGVVPEFMRDLAYPRLSEVVWTDTMARRKELMRENTDIAIALPGGIGTIDELIETYVLAKLKIYKGKIVALNVNGFYDPLASMLDHFVSEGTLLREDRDLLCMPGSLDELKKMI